MKSAPDTRSPETFVEQLEACTLPAEAFDHRGHVYAAWACLRQPPPGPAMDRFCRALHAYAAHLGVPEKVHETLTRALLMILHERMQRQPGASWEDFVRDHRDLVEQAPAVVARHYSPARLNCAAARSRFLAPDRAPLPEPVDAPA